MRINQPGRISLKPTPGARMRRMLIAGLVIAMSAGFAQSAWAKHRQGQYVWITAQLTDGSNHRQMEAIGVINHLMGRPGHHFLPIILAKTWLPLLIEDGHDATAAKLARENILLHPGVAGWIGLWQQWRVEALLAMGKTQAAFRNAKSLFYECPLGQTRTALLLLQECLAKVYPHGHKLIALFIHEQMAGAWQPGLSCKVLSLTKIHANPYAKVLATVHGTSQWALCEKGNLLLLMGRVNRALRQMKLAAALAGDARDYLADAANVARAMKAVDGTVYRANRYMLTAAHRAALLAQ